jgi:acyl-CoA synthetase (AMP-forming)/AMP-acid ligase II
LLAAPSQIDPVSGENLDKAHNVRIAFGNGLRPDIWNRFKARFAIDSIAEFYSATESPSASWNMSSNDFSVGAVGRQGMLVSLLVKFTTAIVELNWETEVPLRLSNGYCRRVPPNSPGELLYKIDAQDIKKNYQGYFSNSKALDGKILRDVFKQGDAWFRTGDVFRLDSEGRWYFCDRVGDTFRWKSENVSTAQVSEVLGAYPAVLEANVYGVEIPHHDGRAGCAALKLAGGKATQEVLDGVASLVQNQLPKNAVPLFLRLVREMQSTGNNKQQKHHLREQGVNLGKVRKEGGNDMIYWLKEGRYSELRDEDWEDIKAGKIRL